ncbi:receptor-like protein EIX1 [Oryza sativa Japonica Group]|nr:receptor-like protein EIX1 [Oryza sativa Japonica Group]ABA94382.1 Leucine Rich Repeat family protein, expressed [Oryza sativa Japonica Group]EAZ18765.1 hypothetical protein OsJ_34291 [Oryza sativa Japonica Group]BAH95337.1 Os11g0565920 [Oryza sativa Japonica Group]|eukprot:NP_001176609.1 Os11g0565920 [Oryza sativa Japonica Group]
MRPTTTAALLILSVLAVAALATTNHEVEAAVAALPRGATRRPAPAHGNVATAAGCSPRERDALLTFKAGITEDIMGLLDSWKYDGAGPGQAEEEADCCRWRGVRCGAGGHVVGLHLRNVYADQSNDYDFITSGYDLAGEISPSLLNLTYLEHIDLSKNQLQGQTGRVPEFLGSLQNLRYLNLSGIPFSGEVPPQLGNLTNLHYLGLSDTGINFTDIQWLARLHSLTHLDMSHTSLSMVHDWADVMNNIPSLKVLHLAYCNLVYADQSFSHFNLTNLEELDLSVNYFNHPIASCWFWNAQGLKYLNLGSTKLYGQFPNVPGQFGSLRFLDLSSTCNIDIVTTNLTNLCNLRIIHLERSQIHGDIAKLLQRLPRCSYNRLNELYLSDNNISGILPNRLDHLTSLVILDISHNKLSGPLPPQIGMFSNLTYLDLSSNNLNGVIIDEHFTSMRSLKTLDLSGNSLKILVDSEWLPLFSLEVALFSPCHMGPRFPGWLKQQVNITYLNMSFAGITDRLPNWFSTTFLNAQLLDVSNNEINGSLPANMEVMTTLSRLYMGSNKLTGQIPLLPKALEIMDISRNSLSGPLPSNFGDDLVLSYLHLFSNRITGHIPNSMCDLHHLVYLDLADNLLEGEFPRCFQPVFLSKLFVSNNILSGKFPPFLRSRHNLEMLDLASNDFYGGLPIWIGELSNLAIVRLSNNNFSGNIPTSITNLTRLVQLDLSNNSISGVLPLHLSNLICMKKSGHCDIVMVFDRYSISGRYGRNVGIANMSVDTKGQKLYYKLPIVLDIVTIDLSLNYLTGEIPEELTLLDGIKNLNLSWNQLSGRIPGNISVMQSLESLDLSKNNLSGEIPSNLSNITSLSRLDLSYNHLTGRIPSGGQLDTLYAENPSMYNGNTGLCGYPLRRNCSDNSSASKHGVEQRRERDSEPMFLYSGLGSGFVAGLWVVFCTILFKKTWRIAYFRLFDKVYDKVYVFVVVTWATLSQKSGTR